MIIVLTVFGLIEERLSKIKRTLVVASSKGGVGKSIIASTLALTLAKKGYKTGLLDLDFYGLSDSSIIGALPHGPEEDNGEIIPVQMGNLHFMSIVFYVDGARLPLRSDELFIAMTELLSKTRWPELDFLIIDMPPGICNLIAEVMRCIPKAEFLVVTTPSKLAVETAKRLLVVLKDIDARIFAIVENMNNADSINDFSEFKELFVCSVPYDDKLEDAIGNADALLKTNFAKGVEKIAKLLAE